MTHVRVQLYDTLAAALATPPDWLAAPGYEWPITAAAAQLADQSPAVAAVTAQLGAVPAASSVTRRRRYQKLFSGQDQPSLWLYESQWRNGRFMGPAATAVGAVYAAAGLAAAGAELPDHAAVELSFLAYLAEQQLAEPAQAAAWKRLERRFIAVHAGKWLPDLGHKLAASGDAVYGPIGRLLAIWLEIAARKEGRAVPAGGQQPRLAAPAACTLCGFCVQVCPTRALFIHETETTTTLQLKNAACIGCHKCEHACDARLLTLAYGGVGVNEVTELRRSQRACCRGCGRPMVSEAEMAYVRAQIGPQPWLELCMDCRTGRLEDFL